LITGLYLLLRKENEKEFRTELLELISEIKAKGKQLERTKSWCPILLCPLRIIVLRK
jgi:uncharacterized protein YaaR (DUF327 family)